MWRPCSTTSSPVFTIAVISAGGVTWMRPDRKRAAPTPPASTVIIAACLPSLDGRSRRCPRRSPPKRTSRGAPSLVDERGAPPRRRALVRARLPVRRRRTDRRAARRRRRSRAVRPRARRRRHVDCHASSIGNPKPSSRDGYASTLASASSRSRSSSRSTRDPHSRSHLGSSDAIAAHVLGVGTVGACDRQRHLGIMSCERLEGVHQPREVLARLERADRDDRPRSLAAGVPGSRGRGRPEWHRDDPVGLEERSGLHRDVLGDRVDPPAARGHTPHHGTERDDGRRAKLARSHEGTIVDRDDRVCSR